MDNTILNTVKHYISQHRLLSEDGLWLVALSGGADSVALLLMLKQLGFVVEAIHCNFHLRGEESERDERFCIDLCEKNAIPLHLVFPLHKLDLIVLMHLLVFPLKLHQLELHYSKLRIFLLISLHRHFEM